MVHQPARGLNGEIKRRTNVVAEHRYVSEESMSKLHDPRPAELVADPPLPLPVTA